MNTYTFLALLLILSWSQRHAVQAASPEGDPRQISGVYPHLTTYGIYSQGGAHLKQGHNECGIGAVVPWAGKLWMVNYAPHMPQGSEHKLFSIDEDLDLTIHPESVGGTPAGRMIHQESQQLLIAHYLIDAQGGVRVIPIERMPIRVTAIARHLSDPANRVYYIDMEGSIWEADVHTLEVQRLFKKPVPGWHAKGGYTGQGRLIVSNNGELAVGDYQDVLVGGKAAHEDEAGVLAEWNGNQWRIVERRQYTDITGPRGIAGGGDSDDPVWAIGWDRRSLRLKLLDDGQWSTYLLPKASLCNDARHGWYTEWPRIREITAGRWMMDMHGMFFDFPSTFSRTNTEGLRPISSHLRYVPDFCAWNGRLVLATDETSIQGNSLAGQPQSNLWFGSYEDLKTWGPANGYGGPWIEDKVAAGVPSDPFLVAGFDHRVLHLATGRQRPGGNAPLLRASDQQPIHRLPEGFAPLPRVTVPRGDWHQPAPGYTFTVNQPVTVYLAVDRRGDPTLDAAWEPASLSLAWGDGHQDRVYLREFPAGTVDVPGNVAEHTPGAFGMPHMAFVRARATADAASAEPLEVVSTGPATVVMPTPAEPPADAAPVVVTLQTDAQGDGHWADFASVTVPASGYVAHLLPTDLDATWLRLQTDRDCLLTAFLHQTSVSPHPSGPSDTLFRGLAGVDDSEARGARVYAAKQSRDLRVLTDDDRYFDFVRGSFQFVPREADPALAELLEVEPEFRVDAASVVLEHRGQRWRLPKGHERFDRPFAAGWPRASREVESERHLANIHGTFYEVPLLTNDQPPAFELMRPVASHAKQITDFCSWNGLLVLAGVRRDAAEDGHVFADGANEVGLWFGGIDDLWKLGKPVGRGGPWHDTAVQAQSPSDPYLMTGYDKKTLELSASTDTMITIEVDFDHQSGWHSYKTVQLRANEPVQYEFPKGFSAHWVRFTAADACQATAQLVYE